MVKNIIHLNKNGCLNFLCNFQICSFIVKYNNEQDVELFGYLSFKAYKLTCLLFFISTSPKMDILRLVGYHPLYYSSNGLATLFHGRSDIFCSNLNRRQDRVLARF